MYYTILYFVCTQAIFRRLTGRGGRSSTIQRRYYPATLNSKSYLTLTLCNDAVHGHNSLGRGVPREMPLRGRRISASLGVHHCAARLPLRYQEAFGGAADEGGKRARKVGHHFSAGGAGVAAGDLEPLRVLPREGEKVCQV